MSFKNGNLRFFKNWGRQEQCCLGNSKLMPKLGLYFLNVLCRSKVCNCGIALWRYPNSYRIQVGHPSSSQPAEGFVSSNCLCTIIRTRLFSLLWEFPLTNSPSINNASEKSLKEITPPPPPYQQTPFTKQTDSFGRQYHSTQKGEDKT